jgi:hypothetical protein
MLLDRAICLGLTLPATHTCEDATQIRRQQVSRLIPVQFEVTHVFVRRNKRLLKFMVDFQQPVEIVRIALFFTKLAYLLQPFLHFLRHVRTVDDDLLSSNLLTSALDKISSRRRGGNLKTPVVSLPVGW